VSTASRTDRFASRAASRFPIVITTMAGHGPQPKTIAKMKAVESRIPSGC